MSRKRALLLIAGAVVLVCSLADYPAELVRRGALPSDLKPALGALTPGDLVQRCGAPSWDAISDFTVRDLVYERDRIAVRFIRTGPGARGWTFSSFRERVNGRVRPAKDPRQTFAAMPCLATP